MAEFAWSARLARVGVYSMEVTPRLITADTRLGLHTTDLPQRPTVAVPLADRFGIAVGIVVHVQMTAHSLYAFGVVTDVDIAAGMRSGALTPEFAMRRSRYIPDAGVHTITHGEIAAVRAMPNPDRIPGARPLWSGLAFTVEEPT